MMDTTHLKYQMFKDKINSIYQTKQFNGQEFTVGDIGSGTGNVIRQIRTDFPGTKPFGVDLNANMFANNAQTYHGTTTIQGFAQDFKLPKNISKPDVLIYSSILHEIHSYDPNSDINYDAIKQSFKHAYKILKPNGYIMIRDFVAPTDGNRPVILKINIPKSKRKENINMSPTEFVYQFLNHSKEFKDIKLMPNNY